MATKLKKKFGIDESSDVAFNYFLFSIIVREKRKLEKPYCNETKRELKVIN